MYELVGSNVLTPGLGLFTAGYAASQNIIDGVQHPMQIATTILATAWNIVLRDSASSRFVRY